MTDERNNPLWGDKFCWYPGDITVTTPAAKPKHPNTHKIIARRHSDGLWYIWREGERIEHPSYNEASAKSEAKRLREQEWTKQSKNEQ